jgi:hypothetical protein
LVAAAANWQGFLVVGNRLRALPFGSFLDCEQGVFYWQPGPGFLGDYSFVFIKKNQHGEYKKRNIKIIITPGFQIREVTK